MAENLCLTATFKTTSPSWQLVTRRAFTVCDQTPGGTPYDGLYMGLKPFPFLQSSPLSTPKNLVPPKLTFALALKCCSVRVCPIIGLFSADSQPSHRLFAARQPMVSWSTVSRLSTKVALTVDRWSIDCASTINRLSIDTWSTVNWWSIIDGWSTVNQQLIDCWLLGAKVSTYSTSTAYLTNCAKSHSMLICSFLPFYGTTHNVIKYSSNQEARSYLDPSSLIGAVRSNNCHLLPEVFSYHCFLSFLTSWRQKTSGTMVQFSCET